LHLPSVDASQTSESASSHRFKPEFTGYQSTGGSNPAFDFGLVFHACLSKAEG
jgi:hypothetical protein